MRRTAKERSVSSASGLRLHLLGIVLFALIPIAALSVWQGFERLSLDQESVRDALRQGALSAASDDLNVFASAEQLLRSLALNNDIHSGNANCQLNLQRALKGQRFFVNLRRVSAEGDVICAAVLSPKAINLQKYPWWNDARAGREFTIAGPVQSDALGRPVLVAILPITNEDGLFLGTLNLAIDISWLDFVQRRKQKTSGAVVALFHRSGEIVASNDVGTAKIVFAKGAAVKPAAEELLSTVGPQGQAWSFAIAPIVHHDYFVGFAMPSSELFRFTYAHVAVHMLLPLLMVVLASLAIWLAIDRLALRWIVLLQRLTAVYGGGHYALRPVALRNAPREFQDLTISLSNMAAMVQERDNRLRELLAHKDVLIKDIHHRVKNNLQVVMSLLSLQSSRLKDPPARDAVEQVRIRVSGFALVIRMIYEQGHDGFVDLRPMLSEVASQFVPGVGAGRRQLDVGVSSQNYNTTIDMAIPLALFVIEALTIASMRSSGQPSVNGTISISLMRISPSQFALLVADDGKGGELEPDPREQEMCARLIAGIALQVDGEVETVKIDTGGNSIRLTFPDKSHASGELLESA